MKRGMTIEELHLDLLSDYNVTLKPNGEVDANGERVYFDETIVLDYCNEEPNDWAENAYFEGPTWLWTEPVGWLLWEKGVTINGYPGLNATVVNKKEDGVHIVKVTE